MTKSGEATTNHDVVSHQQWVAARRAFLAREKDFTQQRDRLSRERRELPWEKVDKQYTFEGTNGSRTLAELFGSSSQLIVYHFMFAPEWDEGCPSCSFWADNFDGIDIHLWHRDASFVAISRAPMDKIEAFKERMGWRFNWLSSADSDFNFDFYASFTDEERARGTGFYNYVTGDPGESDHSAISVFYKDSEGSVFHTYSCYARGVDIVNGAYNYLDLAPKGRDEDPDATQSWVRHHDRYDD